MFRLLPAQPSVHDERLEPIVVPLAVLFVAVTGSMPRRFA